MRIGRSFQEARGARNRNRSGKAAKETLRYARRDHRVLALLAVKFGWGLAGGVLVLVPLLARGRFHAGELGIGLLLAARGVGALVGPFVGRATLGDKDRRLFLTIGVALAVFGAGYALLGIVSSLLLALPAVALAHTGGGVPVDALVLRAAEDRSRPHPRPHLRVRRDARDAHVRHVSVLTGWLAEMFGASETAVIMGGVAVVWAARLDVAHHRRAARHDDRRLRRPSARGVRVPAETALAD